MMIVTPVFCDVSASHMGISKNSGTPKSSILIGFSIINHSFWVPLFLETPISIASKPCNPKVYSSRTLYHWLAL